jgi:hypothetical protein
MVKLVLVHGALFATGELVYVQGLCMKLNEEVPLGNSGIKREPHGPILPITSVTFNKLSLKALIFRINHRDL